MGSPEETAQSIRDVLEPFVRPREEASTIRRILAAHLASSLKTDALGGCLALLNVPPGVDTFEKEPNLSGLQREYLRALQANAHAQRSFDQTTQEIREASKNAIRASSSDSALPDSESSILEDHMVSVQMRRKKERLQVVHRYLDALQEKPAAAENFLRPETIYGDATLSLPSVPKAVVDGLVEEQAAADDRSKLGSGTVADLNSLVVQLQKSVLRAQLVLRQEEKQLAEAKERSQQKHGNANGSLSQSKLRALGTARDELIAWVETELSNAAGGDEGEADESMTEASRLLRQSILGGDSESKSKVRIDEKLAVIREKYASYVEARRKLIELTDASSSGGKTQQSVFANIPQLLPVTEKGNKTAPTNSITETSKDTAGNQPASGPSQAKIQAAHNNILLTPSLEQLLTVAHEQKGAISHKSHFHVVLAKRLKDTRQTLDHLVDESQLLPRHPMPGASSSKRQGAGGGGTSALLSKKMNVFGGGSGSQHGIPDGSSQHVAAWTYAADSAKIATFEVVAEQVEEGQVALERATEKLDEIDELLGRDSQLEENEGEAPSEEVTRVGARAQKSEQEPHRIKDDIWSTLHGELGTIKADDMS